MTDAKPADTTPLAISAVAEEFAVLADFFRQRLLMRANQVDQLQASHAEVAKRLADAPAPDAAT